MQEKGREAKIRTKKFRGTFLQHANLIHRIQHAPSPPSQERGKSSCISDPLLPVASHFWQQKQHRGRNRSLRDYLISQRRVGRTPAEKLINRASFIHQRNHNAFPVFGRLQSEREHVGPDGILFNGCQGNLFFSVFRRYSRMPGPMPPMGRIPILGVIEKIIVQQRPPDQLLPMERKPRPSGQPIAVICHSHTVHQPGRGAMLWETAHFFQAGFPHQQLVEASKFFLLQKTIQRFLPHCATCQK